MVSRERGAQLVLEILLLLLECVPCKGWQNPSPLWARGEDEEGVDSRQESGTEQLSMLMAVLADDKMHSFKFLAGSSSPLPSTESLGSDSLPWISTAPLLEGIQGLQRNQAVIKSYFYLEEGRTFLQCALPLFLATWFPMIVLQLFPPSMALNERVKKMDL